MKKFLACLLALCILGGIFSSSIFAEGIQMEENVNAAIQPRANIVDVISTQVYLINNSTGRVTLMEESYYRLNYVNGYQLENIRKERITTIGDVLNNMERERWVYEYTTW